MRGASANDASLLEAEVAASARRDWLLYLCRSFPEQGHALAKNLFEEIWICLNLVRMVSHERQRAWTRRN